MTAPFTAPSAPVTPSPLRGRIALGAAGIVALGAIVGSASSLYRIALGAQLALPLALPVALDLLALSAAAAVRARHRDRLAWTALFAATAVSTVLQVSDAPPDLRAQVVHGAVPVAALLAFELALRAMRPDTPARAPAAATAPTPATPPAIELEYETPPPAPEPARRPPTPKTPRTRPTSTQSRPSARPLAELVPIAERVAGELAAEGRNLSRRVLQDAMKQAGAPVGTNRASELLDHLRSAERPALELVESTP